MEKKAAQNYRTMNGASQRISIELLQLVTKKIIPSSV